MEPHERKVHTLVQHLQLIKTDKVITRELFFSFSVFRNIYLQPYSYNFINSKLRMIFFADEEAETEGRCEEEETRSGESKGRANLEEETT